MPTHSFLLYVEDPVTSAAFYEKLLRKKPIEASPGFAMFELTAPTMLGLWKRDDVLPKVTAPTGTNEIGFHVESNAVVDNRRDRYCRSRSESTIRHKHKWLDNS